MGAFDISYNDIAGAPLGSGKKKVAPIQAAQGIAAPTAALSSPQMIDAQPSIIQAPAVQQLVPTQSITQGAESYMRAHQPGDAVAISYPPIMPDATTSPSPVPAMPMPPGIAKSMSGGAGQQPAPATIADIRRPTMQAQPMRATPRAQTEAAPTGPMVSQEVKDGLANGAAQAFSSTIGAIQKSGDAAQRAAGDGNYGGAIGHVIRGAAGGIAGFGDDVMRSAAKVLDPAANALKTLVTGDGTPINQDAPQSAAVKTIADVVQPVGQQSYRPGSATANALNETDTFQQSRPGDPLAPALVPQKPGRNAEGVITAESAKGAMGSDMQRSGGVFGTMDMKGVNDIMEREKNARGEMIDSMIKANGGNGIGIMSDGGIEADNDEKTARWRQDDLLAKARFNPAAGQVALESARGQNHIAAETVRGGNQMATEQGRNAVTRRGQDMTAHNEANRLSIDAPYRLAQAAGQEQQNRSTSAIADLQQRAIAGDSKAIETLRALNGKTNQATDRFMAVQGGEEIGPDGMTKIKRPGGVFDAQTGRFVEMNPQQGGAGKFSKADVESALAKGADKAKIAERIKSMGGNPADYGL